MINQDFADSVINFFNENDWSPAEGDYINTDARTCCPIGAACIEKGYDIANARLLTYFSAAKFLDVDSNFTWGVMAGFDGYRDASQSGSKEETDGIDTGIYLRERLL